MLAALWLAGCAPAPKSQPAADEPIFTTAESRAVISLLDAFQQWQSMPEESLNRELAAANAAYVRDASDMARVRLALLLSMPNSSLHNDARALSLLAAVQSGASAPASASGHPLRELALLLQTQIVERIRTVNEAVKRGDELAQKLDALRKLEHSLIEREQKTRDK
jgi:hypothetical protein